MQHSPEYSCNSLPSSVSGTQSTSGKAATIVYQCVTVAAMLLLLGSLWIF